MRSTFDSRQSTGRNRTGAALAALFLLAAAPKASVTDQPGVRNASLLAGEVDAGSLFQRIGQEKGKVVLVNFWATWCAPCREEFPDLSRLQKTLGEKGLRVIGVSTDFARETPAVERFLAEQKPSFPNYRKKSGGDDQVFIEAVEKSWGGELPFSVLYGKDGRKAKTFSGKHSYAEYEKEVLKLARP
ncbi:MAG TPA: TlpA disulfide reductase family protein [Thermoanaerobaculia bacterium]|nr:TlpA disulfide reductase family protein [Thermoanaerobaculia bacterium]